MANLGAGRKHAPSYPGDRYDLIWTDPYRYLAVTAEASEACPGLDVLPFGGFDGVDGGGGGEGGAVLSTF